MVPYVIGLIVVVSALLALLTYGLMKVMKEDSLARQSPPDARYAGDRVEIPKLSECLSDHGSPEEFGWMHSMGVHQIEMVTEDPKYVACAFNPGVSCGWRARKRVEITSLEGGVILDYGNLYMVSRNLFGVRLEVEEDGVRAFVPSSVVTTDTNFAAFCGQVADAMVGRSIDALSWLPKPE